MTVELAPAADGGGMTVTCSECGPLGGGKPYSCHGARSVRSQHMHKAHPGADWSAGAVDPGRQKRTRTGRRWRDR